NSILDLARMESGRLSLDLKEFDLREMIESLLDALAVPAFEKQIELVGRLSADVPRMVVGDSFRLRQVLTNLIGNAIKFTERGRSCRFDWPARGRWWLAIARRRAAVCATCCA